MDSWYPDEDKSKKIAEAFAFEEEVEVRPAFSANCAKCGKYTAEDPELRGWWPAINGKFCEEKSDPVVDSTDIVTWYCKQCYIEENTNILIRVIRKLFN